MSTIITDELRNKHFDTASPTVQLLYTSTSSGRIMREVFEKYKLNRTLYFDYALIVGDVILGLHQKSELRTLLESELKLNGEVAQKIEADLKPLLSKIDGVPSIPPAEAELKEKLELRPEGVSRPVDIPTPPSSSQPLTREAIMSTLTPKRTMANDIASLGGGEGKIHGYEAYVAKKESAEEK